MSCFGTCFSKQKSEKNVAYNNRSTALPMNLTEN